MTMRATYYSDGKTIDHTPSSAVAAGDVVVVNDRLVGIATEDIAANVKGALAIKGCFKVAKESQAFIVGQDVYWDEDAEVAMSSITVGGQAAYGAYMGKCVEAADADDDYVKVLLVISQTGELGTATGTGTAGV